MPRLEPAPGLCPPGASAGPARFTPSLGVPADSTLPASTCAVSARAQGEVATRCLLPCPFLNLVHGVTSTERLRPETREPSSHSAHIQSKASPSVLPPMPLEPTLLSASRLDKTATSIPADASWPVPLTRVLSLRCSHRDPSQQEADHGRLVESPSVAFHGPGTEPPATRHTQRLSTWTSRHFLREPFQAPSQISAHSALRFPTAAPLSVASP